MNYGFAIDTRSCIGCHACSTACKSENAVPLGVSRTWVKVTEVGVYPDTRRNFQVTRCNHCSDAPCVKICPVSAMYNRDDGIVEFDPETQTAAKCHFCAHRIEVGQEPACVTVCPTHAILAGDLDDPASEISRVVSSNSVTVRKPEQGTGPKLFYIDGHDISLHPTALDHDVAGLMFTEAPRAAPAYTDQVAEAGEMMADGPIRVAPGRMAEHMAQVAYRARSVVPWHWQVPAYMVTKGIGAGVFALLALGSLFGWWVVSARDVVWIGGIGLLAQVATVGLLLADLERPDRFLNLILRPQFKSWIARAVFILIGMSVATGSWWLAELLTYVQVVDLTWLRLPLAGVTLPMTALGASYTAFLFAQCEGRDLWQSPLMPLHLLVQAIVAGAATWLAIAPLGFEGPAATLLIGALVVDAVAILGELGTSHASELASRAARDITSGPWSATFWIGAILVGHVIALLLALGGPIGGVLGGLAALAGLYAYEHVFVMAPQHLPNS